MLCNVKKTIINFHFLFYSTILIYSFCLQFIELIIIIVIGDVELL